MTMVLKRILLISNESTTFESISFAYSYLFFKASRDVKVREKNDDRSGLLCTYFNNKKLFTNLSLVFFAF